MALLEHRTPPNAQLSRIVNILQQKFLGYESGEEMTGSATLPQTHASPSPLAISASFHKFNFSTSSFFSEREVVRTILCMQCRSARQSFSPSAWRYIARLDVDRIDILHAENLGCSLGKIHWRQKCLWATFDCVAASVFKGKPDQGKASNLGEITMWAQPPSCLIFLRFSRLSRLLGVKSRNSGLETSGGMLSQST